MANGKVEALVKTARRRFFVPIPNLTDIDQLNDRLMAGCLERLVGLEGGTAALALLADLETLRHLPATPFDACEQVSGRASSTALARYRLVDYSVPVAHAHQQVMIKGYVDRVEIIRGQEVIARHRRSYERGDVVYDPLHYLALLERKPGALVSTAEQKPTRWRRKSLPFWDARIRVRERGERLGARAPQIAGVYQGALARKGQS